MYFFVISTAGLDKNGNRRYKVTGFQMGTVRECYPLLKPTMDKLRIGYRWDDKTKSLVTKLNIEQILEHIEVNLDEYYQYAII